MRWPLAALLLLLASLAQGGEHKTGTNPSTGHKVGTAGAGGGGGGGGGPVTCAADACIADTDTAG